MIVRGYVNFVSNKMLSDAELWAESNQAAGKAFLRISSLCFYWKSLCIRR